MFCENVLFVYCIFLLVGNLDKCANTLYSVDHNHGISPAGTWFSDFSLLI